MKFSCSILKWARFAVSITYSTVKGAPTCALIRDTCKIYDEIKKNFFLSFSYSSQQCVCGISKPQLWTQLSPREFAIKGRSPFSSWEFMLVSSLANHSTRVLTTGSNLRGEEREKEIFLSDQRDDKRDWWSEKRRRQLFVIEGREGGEQRKCAIDGSSRGITHSLSASFISWLWRQFFCVFFGLTD